MRKSLLEFADAVAEALGDRWSASADAYRNAQLLYEGEKAIALAQEFAAIVGGTASGTEDTRPYPRPRVSLSHVADGMYGYAEVNGDTFKLDVSGVPEELALALARVLRNYAELG